MLALCLAATTCGKKGDPQPPLRRLPQPATAFEVAQRGEQIVVRLTTPSNYTDGTRLPVMEVELLRADQAGDFAKQAKSRRLRAAPGESLVESEPLPQPGTQLRYAARVLAKGKASPPSGVAMLVVQPAAPQPTGLTVRRTASGSTLDWSAPVVPALVEPASPAPASPPAPATPASQPSPSAVAEVVPEAASPSPPPAAAPSPSPSASPSAPTSGFWVYRRTATGRYAGPLSPAPLAGPPLEDHEISTETVCYVVRTVVATEPLIESADSNEVCVPPEMPAPSPGA